MPTWIERGGPWFIVALVTGGAWALAVPLLHAATIPGGRGVKLFIVVVAYGTVCLVWFLFSCSRDIWVGSQVRPGLWASALVAGVLTFAVTVHDWGVAARLRLHEADVRAYIARPGHDDRIFCPERRTHSPLRVGGFVVNRTVHYGGGVFLFTGDADVVSEDGIAFLPPGCALPTSVRVSHLYGDWYRFEFRD